MRSRSVSFFTLHSTLEIPAAPARLLADWHREASTHLCLESGGVEQLPLPRMRRMWPEHSVCLQAMRAWTRAVGLQDLLMNSEMALMASRGARYHHDGAQYGGMAFCNLFMSEDQGLDLHFPLIDTRIPLTRGTAVVFDTGQPHAVIRRGSSGFDAADFADEQCTQVFLTWELPIENEALAQSLHIAFDTDPGTALHMTDEGIRVNGAAVKLCADTGRWLPASP
jgi:hypothetical protein